MVSLMLRVIAVVLLGLSGGGCATVVTGTTQSISVNSDPSDADCTLKRDGQPLGTVRTPGLLTVKRDAKPIQVVCTKDAHDDGKHVMESKFETATMGNLALGGIVGVMVDAASGANSRYDTNITVQLTPLSAADQAAAAQLAARRKTPPDSSGAAGSLSSAANPYDGEYEGDVELVQRLNALNFRRHTRHIEVRVVDGVGKGTIKHPQCSQPGDLDFTIDSMGQVRGTANTINTDGCVAHKATLEGRVDGKDIRLTVTRERFDGWSTDFSLVRKSSSQTSAAESRIEP